MKLSMYYGPKETLEYMQVNIWCMLDWIVGFCHKIAEIYFPGITRTYILKAELKTDAGQTVKE